LGVAHLQQNHPEEAERWLTEYVDQKPASAPGHLNLFKACLALEKTEEAWEHLNTAIQLDPSHLGALEQLAHLLVKADRRDEALARLREIGKSSATATAPWWVLARLYGEENDGGGELECLAEAHRRSPKEERILLAYTAALGRLKRPETAVKILEPIREAISLELSFNLALAFRSMGKATEGRKVLEAFLQRPSVEATERDRVREILEKWDRRGDTPA
jgi:tetratricopeptide (TPR) repeat protein